MHMVVDVLAGDDWQNRVCVLAIHMEDLILELGSFLGQASLNLVLVIVVEAAMLDCDEVEVMLLIEGQLVSNGLD